MSNERELLNKTLKRLIDQAQPNSSDREIEKLVEQFDNYDESSENTHYNFWDGSDAAEAHHAQATRTFLKENFDIDITNPDINASFRLLEIDPEYYKLVKIVNGNTYEEVLSKLQAKAKLLKQIG